MAACRPGEQATEEPDTGGGQTGSAVRVTPPPFEPPENPNLEELGDISGDIQLDPATVADDDSRRVSSLVYDRLVTLDGAGNVVPAIAQSWVTAEDGLSYVITLQPDATFADGTVIDADVVVANFDRWFDPDSPIRGSGDYQTWLEMFNGFKGELDAEGNPVSIFDGAEKQDDISVVLHLNEPDPDFLVKLADPAFSILSPNALAAFGSSYGTSQETTVAGGRYFPAGMGF